MKRTNRLNPLNVGWERCQDADGSTTLSLLVCITSLATVPFTRHSLPSCTRHTTFACCQQDSVVANMEFLSFLSSLWRHLRANLSSTRHPCSCSYSSDTPKYTTPIPPASPTHQRQNAAGTEPHARTGFSICHGYPSYFLAIHRPPLISGCPEANKTQNHSPCCGFLSLPFSYSQRRWPLQASLRSFQDFMTSS